MIYKNNLKYKYMSIFKHFDDLRKHVIRIIISIIICFIILIFNKKILFENIILAPSKNDFFTYRFFNFVSNFIKKSDFLILKENIRIQNRKLLGQFNIYIWGCLLGGLIMASPYIFYEIWRFINPGLSKKEKNILKLIFIIASILFLMGSIFGYFIMFPMLIQFGVNFTISKIPENIIDLSEYISSIIQCVLYTGIMFLFPIFIFFLSKNKLITYNFLKKYRKHAILILFIVASAITPSDVLTTIIVMIPLLILYEISLLLIKYLDKK